VGASRRSTSSPLTRRTALICAGLVLLTFALYWRVLQYPFITYDDRLYVSENPHVLGGLTWGNISWAFTTWHTGNWHPLTWLSLMLDAHLFGTNASSFHFTNVLLHAANSVLLFVVLRRLTGVEWQSAFVAALFALHPGHVESVAWISERKDVLSALFFFLALGAYGRYVAEPNATRYGVVATLFVLGLLAKSMLVTLPFILLLLDFWPLQRIRGQRSEVTGQKSQVTGQERRSALLIEKLPLFAITAVFFVVAFLAQRSAGSTMPMTVFPVGARVTNAVLSYERYLGKLFWPRDLTLPHPFARSISALELCWALALLAAISFVAIRTARTRPYLLIGWLWFLGMLIPVIGLVQVGPQAMADRYMYLPTIGIFMALTWAISGATSTMSKYLPAGVACAVLIALGSLCVTQLGYWRNSETLFRHTLAIYPGEIVSLRNLTSTYAIERRPRDAITTLELLLIETPQDAAAHLHLGQALQQIGDDGRAANEYEAALKFGRDTDKENISSAALNNLAWIRATSSDPTLRNGGEAVQLAERGCSLSPNPDAGQLDTLAAAYAESGDFERAIQTADRALQLADSTNNQRLAREISQHVYLYRRHLPLREKAAR
jgi:hypothetical protein